MKLVPVGRFKTYYVRYIVRIKKGVDEGKIKSAKYTEDGTFRVGTAGWTVYYNPEDVEIIGSQRVKK